MHHRETLPQSILGINTLEERGALKMAVTYLAMHSAESKIQE